MSGGARVGVGGRDAASEAAASLCGRGGELNGKTACADTRTLENRIVDRAGAEAGRHLSGLMADFPAAQEVRAMVQQTPELISKLRAANASRVLLEASVKQAEGDRDSWKTRVTLLTKVVEALLGKEGREKAAEINRKIEAVKTKIDVQTERTKAANVAYLRASDELGKKVGDYLTGLKALLDEEAKVFSKNPPLYTALVEDLGQTVADALKAGKVPNDDVDLFVAQTLPHVSTLVTKRAQYIATHATTHSIIGALGWEGKSRILAAGRGAGQEGQSHLRDLVRYGNFLPKRGEKGFDETADKAFRDTGYFNGGLLTVPAETHGQVTAEVWAAYAVKRQALTAATQENRAFDKIVTEADKQLRAQQEVAAKEARDAIAKAERLQKKVEEQTAAGELNNQLEKAKVEWAALLSRKQELEGSPTMDRWRKAFEYARTTLASQLAAVDVELADLGTKGYKPNKLKSEKARLEIKKADLQRRSESAESELASFGADVTVMEFRDIQNVKMPAAQKKVDDLVKRIKDAQEAKKRAEESGEELSTTAGGVSESGGNKPATVAPTGSPVDGNGSESGGNKPATGDAAAK